MGYDEDEPGVFACSDCAKKYPNKIKNKALQKTNHTRPMVSIQDGGKSEPAKKAGAPLMRCFGLWCFVSWSSLHCTSDSKAQCIHLADKKRSTMPMVEIKTMDGVRLRVEVRFRRPRHM